MNKYYIVYIWGDVEPSILKKSFDTSEERDLEAKKFRNSDFHHEEGGIYWLDIINGIPEMGSYSNGFMEGA